MGAPPVIIHFRLGFSHGNQPFSHWVTPWLWRPGTSGPKSATLQPWFMEVVYIEYIYEYDISYLYIYIDIIIFVSNLQMEKNIYIYIHVYIYIYPYIHVYICALVWYDCNKKQTYCVIRYFILSNINPYFFLHQQSQQDILGRHFPSQRSDEQSWVWPTSNDAVNSNDLRRSTIDVSNVLFNPYCCWQNIIVIQYSTCFLRVVFKGWFWMLDSLDDGPTIHCLSGWIASKPSTREMGHYCRLEELLRICASVLCPIWRAIHGLQWRRIPKQLSNMEKLMINHWTLGCCSRCPFDGPAQGLSGRSRGTFGQAKHQRRAAWLMIQSECNVATWGWS